MNARRLVIAAKIHAASWIDYAASPSSEERWRLGSESESNMPPFCRRTVFFILLLSAAACRHTSSSSLSTFLEENDNGAKDDWSLKCPSPSRVFLLHQFAAILSTLAIYTVEIMYVSHRWSVLSRSASFADRWSVHSRSASFAVAKGVSLFLFYCRIASSEN